MTKDQAFQLYAKYHCSEIFDVIKDNALKGLDCCCMQLLPIQKVILQKLGYTITMDQFDNSFTLKYCISWD